MFKKIILWVLLVLVVLLVVLALTINPLLSWSTGKAFNKLAPQITGTPATVESVDVSVYKGRIEIDDLLVGNPQGFSSDNAFSLDKIVLEVAPSSLLGQTVHIEEITIDNPTVTVEYANGKINLDEIRKHLKNRRPAQEAGDKKADKPKESAAPAGEKRKLSVNKLALTDADVQVIFDGKSYKVESPNIVMENVAPEGVSPSELSLLILEKLISQTKFDAAGLPGQISSQITSELEKQIEQVSEQGRGLIKQLEEDSGVKADTIRNLFQRD